MFEDSLANNWIYSASVADRSDSHEQISIIFGLIVLLNLDACDDKALTSIDRQGQSLACAGKYSWIFFLV